MEIALKALNRETRLRDAQLDDMLHNGQSPTALRPPKRKRKNDENTDDTTSTR